jgi:hypothetical protein
VVNPWLLVNTAFIVRQKNVAAFQIQAIAFFVEESFQQADIVFIAHQKNIN